MGGADPRPASPEAAAAHRTRTTIWGEGSALPTYISRGLRLHYEILGEGPPVLLLHGFTNLGLAWSPQLGALVHTGHRVLLPDLAGHGLSDPVAETTTVAHLAVDVRALLEHAGEARCAVAGLSLGGMVAMELALAYPERVSGLLIADSAARFDRPAHAEAVAGWARLLEQPDGPHKRLSTAWPLLVGQRFRDSPCGQAFFASWWEAQAHVSGPSLANVARGMLSFDATARLSGLNVPVVVVVGADDRLLPPSEARQIAAHAARARLAVIPGAGHLSNIEQPAAFNRELLAFLAELERGLGGGPPPGACAP